MVFKKNKPRRSLFFVITYANIKKNFEEKHKFDKQNFEEKHNSCKENLEGKHIFMIYQNCIGNKNAF